MSEPTTEAGRKMWREVRSCLGYGTEHVNGPAILAIEREARAAVLRELREEVEGMREHEDLTPKTVRERAWNRALLAVLIAIDRRLKE